MGTITGTGIDGRTVTLSADTDSDYRTVPVEIGTATVDSGTWSIDYGLALTDGQVDLSVTQSDGVTTSGVFNRTVVIDTEALPPTFDIMPVSQSLRPVITGTGEPGAAVEVRATGGGLTDQPLVGILTDIDMTVGGNSYTTATVEITGGGATSDATATATVVAGVITEITITDPGSGYTSAPTVTITGDGTLATATATFSPLVTVDQDGTWRLPVTEDLPEGVVALSASQTDLYGNSSATQTGSVVLNEAAASPVNFGLLNQTENQKPTITGTAEPSVSILTALTITNPGSGYTTATVAITGGGATSGATATATIVAGVITEITITDPVVSTHPYQR